MGGINTDKKDTRIPSPERPTRLSSATAAKVTTKARNITREKNPKERQQSHMKSTRQFSEKNIISESRELSSFL